jgi:FimV N-terminal domain
MLLLLLTAGPAYGLGLGEELRLYSALNQPLHAELALHLDPDETVDEVRAGLAPRAAYQRLRLPYHDGLPPLGFAVVPAAAGQPPVLRITSREPLREPAVELLLEVRWRSGHLVRQYALLLDLPDRFTPPAVAAPAVPSAPAPTAAAAMATVAAYGPVQRGETLSQIAQRLKPDGVGTPQMTVALFEANPHAFIGGNMNRLRWGTTLYMPAPEAIAARSRGAAGKVMLAQQQALQAPAAPAPAGPVPVPAPPAPALQILAPAAPNAPTGELAQRLVEVRELNATVAVENEELRQRLGELEQQAQRLAEQVLALPQAAAPVPAAPAVPVAPVAPVAPATAAPPEVVGVEIGTAAPLPQDHWWHNPTWWVVVLALLIGLSLALLGWLAWPRSRRWEYRDLALALREDAEAKTLARQELLENTRRRYR